MQIQIFMLQRCNCQMSNKQREGVHYSRQCNQTKSVITHKLDLTTGHLVKLKTRRLQCTYSLGNITTIKCDWLLGKPVLYKRLTNSVVDAFDWHHFQQLSPSFPAVFSSQQVSFKEVQRKFLNGFLFFFFFIGFLLM